MRVKEIPIQPGDSYLLPGDLHFDKHDPEAVELTTRVAQARKVNGVILIGDTFESSGISRHPRLRRRFRFSRGTVKQEAAAARPFIRAWRDLVVRERTVKQAKESFTRPGGLYILTGNHEHWWSEIQDEYPGLVDTPWHELYGDLFDGWHIFEEPSALKLGPLLVAHGHRLRGSLSKHSATAVLANYPGQNTLYGHTHRVDQCTRPTYKYGEPVIHGAWTIGHLRSVPDSLEDPFLGPHAESHQQGFAIVSFFLVDGEYWFDVEQATIHRNYEGAKPFALLSGQIYQ